MNIKCIWVAYFSCQWHLKRSRIVTLSLASLIQVGMWSLFSMVYPVYPSFHRFERTFSSSEYLCNDIPLGNSSMFRSIPSEELLKITNLANYKFCRGENLPLGENFNFPSFSLLDKTSLTWWIFHGENCKRVRQLGFKGEIKENVL